MSHATMTEDRLYSREEYLAWCEANPGRPRTERVDGRIVSMAPERVAHARIKFAIQRELARTIEASDLACELLPDGITIETGDSDYEPDALVHCGPPLDGDAIAATRPVIVVEILSPGTASTDTGAKLAGYFRVPTVAHYLIAHANRPLVIHHRRPPGGGDRIETTIVTTGLIALDPPGITIDLATIYRTPPA